MTSQAGLAVADRRGSEALDLDWVLPFSVKEPTHLLASRMQWTERGPISGFFSGILFDRDELADLGGKKDCSDSDLVLRVYERGGEAALSRLRGSFVVAIIDRTRQLAIVARDPLGSHPLFYTETDSRILFAASPRILLDQPNVSRALNRVALADHLCSRWPDPTETFFAAVRRVPRGSRAIILDGHMRLERYWDPMPEGRPIEWLSADEAARFDELLDRAVGRCLCNGPTGIFLSGGLDSVTVAAVSAYWLHRSGQTRPIALSLGFPHPDCDERPIQAAVARSLGLRQHLLDFHNAIGSRPLLEQALELNREIAAPILSAWMPAYLALARRARLDGVRTILTGQGGDEWLCVSPYLSADLMRHGKFVELVKFLGTLRRSYQVHPIALTRNVLWTCGLRPLAGLTMHRLLPKTHAASRLRRLVEGDPLWVAPDQTLRAEQKRRAGSTMTPSDPSHGFYLRECRQSIDHALSYWESEQQYELGKRVGIQFLRPFCDPDLVEMLFRTPPPMLNEGGRTKALVRQTLARRFPTLGFARQRKVLARSFLESFIQREGSVLADLGGDFPALSELGIVDGRVARADVHAWLKRSGRQLQRAWWVINLEMWARSHLV